MQMEASNKSNNNLRGSNNKILRRCNISNWNRDESTVEIKLFESSNVESSAVRFLQNEDNAGSEGISVTLIIVIAGGAALILVFVIAFIYCWRRSHEAKSRRSSNDRHRLMSNGRQSSSVASKSGRRVSKARSSKQRHHNLSKSSQMELARTSQRDRERQHPQQPPVPLVVNVGEDSFPAKRESPHRFEPVPLQASPSTVSALTEAQGFSPRNDFSPQNTSNVSRQHQHQRKHQREHHLVDLDNFEADDEKGLSEFESEPEFFFPSSAKKSFQHQPTNVQVHAWPPEQQQQQRKNAPIPSRSNFDQQYMHDYPDPDEVYPITSFDSGSDYHAPNSAKHKQKQVAVDHISSQSNDNDSKKWSNIPTGGRESSSPRYSSASGRKSPITNRKSSSPTQSPHASPTNSVHRKSPIAIAIPPKPPTRVSSSSSLSRKGSPTHSPSLAAGRKSPSLIDTDEDENANANDNDMQAAMNAAVLAAAAGGNAGALKAAKEIEKQKYVSSKNRLMKKKSSRRSSRSNVNIEDDSPTCTSDAESIEGEGENPWLFEAVTDTLGPRIVSADMESLGGRSKRSNASKGDKSHRSIRSKRSTKSGTSRSSRRKSKSHRRQRSSNESVGSRGSRDSRRSHKSALSQMSDASRSIAADLMRLETQLAMVGSANVHGATDNNSVVSGASHGNASRGSSISLTRSRHSRSSRVKTTKRDKMNVNVPPGKLGVILADKADNKGTIVSDVRTNSVLYGKIFPGDRIVAIDGEDVSRMTVAEITALMARKAAYDRVLTIVTSVKLNTQQK
mmetsp:Transcript_10657/g.15983  ORF Transcript_10657/g.15983 Transcript_10657/m.15983 type:complete len:789 (-) Transcript_10657:94-2460(-)|eukprot:CAMPEP_0116039154 /NCGR_PEP_ID=MMETSP0321-20121206/23333_1 /TAXON_ID=163516 /ORGANISM="Leptocylindrus danicus var. danicus, Strain B650" /LENGTH=788 /DNA_ID=CAMNT_0003518201 /DNA_START=690 /DNA_END=3056 /DNA_ORIENTATION=+